MIEMLRLEDGEGSIIERRKGQMEGAREKDKNLKN